MPKASSSGSVGKTAEQLEKVEDSLLREALELGADSEVLVESIREAKHVRANVVTMV